MLLENLLRPTHLILVLAIALLVFGPKNLPQIGRGLGEAIRGFKEAVKDGEQSDLAKTPDSSDTHKS